MHTLPQQSLQQSPQPSPTSSRRLWAAAILALFALVGAACSGGQSVETGNGNAVLVDETDADEVPDDVPDEVGVPDTVEDDDRVGDGELITDEGEVTDDEVAEDQAEPEDAPVPESESVVDPEPIDDPQPIPEPEPQQDGLTVQETAYCAAYDITDEAGQNNPETAEEAEQMLNTMIEQMTIVVETAPDDIAEAANEAHRFIKAVAKEAISRDWDPAYFEELSDTDFETTGFDEELIISFFVESEQLCDSNFTEPLEQNQGLPTPVEGE